MEYEVMELYEVYLRMNMGQRHGMDWSTALGRGKSNVESINCIMMYFFFGFGLGLGLGWLGILVQRSAACHIGILAALSVAHLAAAMEYWSVCL